MLRTTPEAPADPGRGAPRTGDRLSLAIVLGAAAVRILLAATIPLVPDETYYWEWSRRLAGGYFDHPYGIALSVRAGTALFDLLGLGVNELAVRLGPVLEGLVAALATVAVARRLGGAGAALRAAIVITVMPLAATGLVLATPDAPLLAATGCAVYGLVRAVESPRNSRVALAWWVVAGLGAGAAMASKYTGILVPIGALAAVSLRPSLRSRLAEPGPYVACVVAALVLVPTLMWNAAHDWLSFTFQLRHGLGGRARGTAVGRELELIGGQAGLVSPILFVLLAIAVWGALRRPIADVHFLLAVVATTAFAFFMVSALRKPVEANWPALAYVPAIPLLASLSLGRRGLRWFRGGWVFAAALTLLIYAHAAASVLPIPPRKDPIARSAGWDALARAVEATRDSVVASQLARVVVHVGADRYQDASEIAFHVRDRPRVFSLNLAGRANQYDLWPGFAEAASPGDALVLVLDDSRELHPVIRRLEPHFVEARGGSVVELRARRGIVARRKLWILTGWSGGWPGADPGG